MTAVKLQTKSTNLIICCIYRAPSSNIKQYLELLDNTSKHLHHLYVELLLCGDRKVNYVTENKNKLKLNITMNAYNLQKIVGFSTRVSKNKGTPNDDTFLDRAKHNYISVYPTNHGLSDHDVQVPTLHRTQISFQNIIQRVRTRLINDQTTAKFHLL